MESPVLLCFLNYSQNLMRCAISYHLYNLKNVKNTHGGISLLVKLQALAVIALHGCFSRFLNCTNRTKSGKASQINAKFVGVMNRNRHRPQILLLMPNEYKRISNFYTFLINFMPLISFDTP